MLFTLFLLAILLVSPKLSFAQDSNQYLSDYKYQLDLYQKKYQNYLEKLEVDSKYSTINTQKDKLQASIETAIQRNNTLVAYSVLLRTKLNNASTNENSQKLQQDLQEKETWLKAQNLNLQQIENKDQLKVWAEQFQIEYPSFQKSFYSTVIQIEANKHLEILQKIQILGQLVQANSPENQQITKWLEELPNQSDLVHSYLNEAYLSTQEKQLTKRFNNFYPEAKKELDLSQNTLKAMSSNLQSILTKFINQWEKI